MEELINQTSAFAQFVAGTVYHVLPSQSALSYIFVVLFLIYLVAPHPASLQKPRVDTKAVKNANWRRVEWEQKLAPMHTGKRYTVVGAGFVGKKLIHSLLLRGERHIRAFDLDPKCCDAFKNDARVEFIRGDVTKYEQVLAAIRDSDVVFATFAVLRFMDSQDHQAAFSYNINVGGTENVIRACQESHVSLLIQTSTSNVCVAKGTSNLAMDEKIDYVTRETSLHHYGWTKAIAEQLVLKADGIAGVRTGSIRPCSAVFGAEDRHMIEPILKLGRTILPPDGGRAVLDFVSVMNVVWGHLLLEQALWTRPDSGVAGEAYCISNNKPMRTIDLCGLVAAMRPNGVAVIPTPQRLLIGIAYMVELVTYLGYKVPGQLGTLTKTTLDYLSITHAFSTRKAHDKLGYDAIFSMEDALQMAVDEWQLGQMLPLLPS